MLKKCSLSLTNIPILKLKESECGLKQKPANQAAKRFLRVLEASVLLTIKSQNLLGWKRPWRSLSSTINLTLASPALSHVPKLHICIFLKYFWAWWLNNLPLQPVPVLDNPFGKQFFANIQSKPPVAQLELFSSMLQKKSSLSCCCWPQNH